jgi:hypothetical protein
MEKCGVSHSVDFGAGIWLAGCDTCVAIQPFVGVYAERFAGHPHVDGTANVGSPKTMNMRSGFDK